MKYKDCYKKLYNADNIDLLKRSFTCVFYWFTKSLYLANKREGLKWILIIGPNFIVKAIYIHPKGEQSVQ